MERFSNHKSQVLRNNGDIIVVPLIPSTIFLHVDVHSVSELIDIIFFYFTNYGGRVQIQQLFGNGHVVSDEGVFNNSRLLGGPILPGFGEFLIFQKGR